MHTQSDGTYGIGHTTCQWTVTPDEATGVPVAWRAMNKNRVPEME